MFEFQKGETWSLTEAVFQAIGAASTCWEHMEGTGIFQSNLAREIGEALMEEVTSSLTPNLGLATTEELLKELIARGEVSATINEHAPFSRALAGYGHNMLQTLPRSMLRYKTTEGERANRSNHGG